MASDHLDAPSLSGNGQQDINDLYAFQPGNASNTALILTVNPGAGVLSPTTFGTNTSYRFEIDNTGDAFSNITYEATFSDTVGGQSFNLFRNGVQVSSGATGVTQAVTGGGQVQAGVFDDPFFFDLAGFNDNFNFTGDDFFAGLNTSAIVLEVPTSELLGATTTFGVFGTTSINGTQIDRVGRPGVNTVVITDLKEEFNAASPDGDISAFSDEVESTVTALGNGANAEAVANLLLPDILTYDTASPADFANLNGRGLADDVIDVALNAITSGALTTDLVAANDVDFLTEGGDSVFPFLAPANAAAVPEPSSALVIAAAFGTCFVRRRRKS